MVLVTIENGSLLPNTTNVISIRTVSVVSYGRIGFTEERMKTMWEPSMRNSTRLQHLGDVGKQATERMVSQLGWFFEVFVQNRHAELLTCLA